MLDGASRTLAFPDYRRDLRVTEPLDEPKEHDLALVLADLRERGVQLAQIVPGEKVILRVGEVRSRRHLAVGQIFESNLGPTLAVVVDHGVVGETDEPGAIGQPALLVAWHRLPGLEEDLLGQILGLAGALDAIGHVAVDAIDVQLVQLAERVRVARLGLSHEPRSGGVASLVSFLPQHSHPLYRNVRGGPMLRELEKKG